MHQCLAGRPVQWWQSNKLVSMLVPIYLCAGWSLCCSVVCSKHMCASELMPESIAAAGLSQLQALLDNSHKSCPT